MESDTVTVSRRPRRRPAVRRPRTCPLPCWQRRPRTRPAAAASWTSAAGQRVSRKYRRGRFDTGRLQQREYAKLRRIVPALSSLDTANQARPRRVSKVTVMHCLSSSNSKQAALCRPIVIYPTATTVTDLCKLLSYVSCQLTCFM